MTLGPTRYEVRPLTVDDLEAAWELGRPAFGSDRTPPPAWVAEWRTQRAWGVIDQSGRLVAQTLDRDQQQWFGGRLVPVSGVAGVVVAPEVRGTGLARRALTALLAAARDRGAVVSTLFPTTAAPYRRLGWEEVGAITWYLLPALSLAGLRRPEDVELRPAVAADVPRLFEVYQTIARAGTGWMERSGPLFATAPDAVLASHDGITVAVGPDGTVQGYAAWDRGKEPDGSGYLAVWDLIGLTSPATVALLAMLGRWASVTPTISLRLAERDPALLVVDTTQARVESRSPWMLRVVDVRGAVEARGWPPHVTGTADLLVEDDVCPWNSGPHRFAVADGSATLEPGGRADVRLTMRGLALLYAGAADPAILRRAGLLSGDNQSDAFLQAATAGPPPALLDSF